MAKKKVMSVKRASAKAPKAVAAPATKKETKKVKTPAKAAAKISAKAKKVTATAAHSAFTNKVIAQKQTKSQIYSEIADMAQVSKSDAKTVLAAIRNLIERHVKPKGSGEITLPELGIKVRRVQKKASKARTGRNPFTGEEIQIPAKPARKSVKVSALKTLKAVIED